MTRINLIPPEELYWKHLVAEYRELPRIFGLVRRADAKCFFPKMMRVPPKFTFGEGHEKFFYDKLTFLVRRQELLINEMHRRGYNTSFDTSSLSLNISLKWFNDWTPSNEDIALSRSRINQRLREMGVIL